MAITPPCTRRALPRACQGVQITAGRGLADGEAPHDLRDAQAAAASQQGKDLFVAFGGRV